MGDWLVAIQNDHIAHGIQDFQTNADPQHVEQVSTEEVFDISHLMAFCSLVPVLLPSVEGISVCVDPL